MHTAGAPPPIPPGRVAGLDGQRARLRAMWASVAPAWAERAAETDARGAALAEAMLDRSALRPGDRVLELACGAGGVGLAAAERVGAGGEVVLSDLVPEMTATAAARARAAGHRNVRARELDIERIDEPDGSYDAVLCREGLMLVPDPPRAVREIHRVLRPGGRVALAVWGPRERNPWLAALFDAAADQLGAPVPPPGIPGPFSLDEPGRLARLLVDAGLGEVRVDEVSVPMRASSFDDWWTRVSALAGPLAQRLAALPDGEVRELHARARARVRDYEVDGGLSFPGISLLAGGRRADG